MLAEEGCRCNGGNWQGERIECQFVLVQKRKLTTILTADNVGCGDSVEKAFPNVRLPPQSRNKSPFPTTSLLFRTIRPNKHHPAQRHLHDHHRLVRNIVPGRPKHQVEETVFKTRRNLAQPCICRRPTDDGSRRDHAVLILADRLPWVPTLRSNAIRPNRGFPIPPNVQLFHQLPSHLTSCRGHNKSHVAKTGASSCCVDQKLSSRCRIC